MITYLSCLVLSSCTDWRKEPVAAVLWTLVCFSADVLCAIGIFMRVVEWLT